MWDREDVHMYIYIYRVTCRLSAAADRSLVRLLHESYTAPTTFVIVPAFGMQGHCHISPVWGLAQ